MVKNQYTDRWRDRLSILTKYNRRKSIKINELLLECAKRIIILLKPPENEEPIIRIIPHQKKKKKISRNKGIRVKILSGLD